ncbi:MAG: DUF6544 family protein, partial [Candidatus Woesearchaeota archaeon]
EFFFISEQYNFFKEPARLFYMKGKMFGINVPGYHKYMKQEARMDIKLFGLIPVVKEKGEVMFVSETVTTFAELCFYAPSFLTDKNITWNEIIKIINKTIIFYEKVYGAKNTISLDKRNIIGDFIKYISVLHPNLMPYDTLLDCRGNSIAYNKLLTALLKKLNLGDATDTYITIKNNKVQKWLERFYIKISEDLKYLHVIFYPADTMKQASVFYKNVNTQLLIKLVDEGWSVNPLLHFSYIGTHLVYADADIHIDDYVYFWVKNSDKIQQYKENGFNILYVDLIHSNMITETDKIKLIKKFNNTKRNHINVAPGIKLVYKLLIEEAEKLEREGQLLVELRHLADRVYSLCN